MKRIFLLTLIFLTGFVDAASGEKLEGPFRLNILRFEGVQSVSRRELTKTLAVQAPPLWKFWLARPVLSIEDLNDDVLRIQQFYQERGYYHTAATFQTEAVDDDKAALPPPANVTFSVTEGPPVLIESVDIDRPGKVKPPGMPDLLSILPLKFGTVFTNANYRAAKKAILEELGNRGHPFADLTGKVTVNTRTNTAKVYFKLDPRKQYNFGPVTVKQPDGGVREIVITRALEFKPGERYAADKVDESRRNLFSLDMFQLALIKSETPGPEAESVPMTIELKPKKKQNIQFGVGYGTEDGLRLKGAWTYRNPWGWASKTSISAKRSDLIQLLQGEYLQPYFLDADNTLSVKAGYERDIYDSYTNRKVFSNAGIRRQIAEHWVAGGGYNLEVNNLEDIRISEPEELKRIREENNYFISSLLGELIYNSADDPLDPKTGSLVALGAEWASDLLGSEVRFVRPWLELRRFQPAPGGITVAGRVRFETIQTDDPVSIPIFKRLFLGGSNTVRGYQFQKIPPLDDNGNPLGGLSSLNANLELRFPIYQKLTGVVFGDMGHLNPDYFRYDSEEIRYTCGAGIRYNTILGPLRLDYGYKLNPPETNQKIDRWQIHFSIGQAF